MDWSSKFALGADRCVSCRRTDDSRVGLSFGVPAVLDLYCGALKKGILTASYTERKYRWWP